MLEGAEIGRRLREGFCNQSRTITGTRKYRDGEKRYEEDHYHDLSKGGLKRREWNIKEKVRIHGHTKRIDYPDC